MRSIQAASAAMVLSLLSAPASAGTYSDELGRCLVSSSTEADKALFVQWIFGALSAGAAVKPLSSLTDAQRDQLNVKIANLMEQLTLKDCHKQTVDALKYEGTNALEPAFGLLGQVATRSMMSDPAVAAEMQKFGAHFDKNKWQAIGKEAGIATPPASAK